MKNLSQLLNEKTRKELISIASDQPVYDALVLLAEHRIGALAIIDNENLVGIFSERDYAREIVLKNRSSRTTLLSEVMTKKVLTGKPTDFVDKIMAFMSEKRIRHLPVVDNDKVIGMLSLGDLVKETISYQQNLITQLEHYIQGG